MRKLSCALVFSLTLLECKSPPKTLQNVYNLYYLHALSPLTPRPLAPHSIGLYTQFSQISSLQALLTQIQYYYSPSNHQWGVGFDYSWSKNISDIFGFTLSYTYFAPSKLYFNTQFKYRLLSSLSSHLFLAHFELGWKWSYHGFFIQPSLSITPSYGTKLELPSAFVSHSNALFYQAGSEFGVEFEKALKGEVKFGVFFDGDQNSLITHHERLTLSLSSFLHATSSFSFYLGSRVGFFSQDHLDYQATLGIRFLWGSPPPSPISPTPTPQGRTFKTLQENLLYDAQQSRLRIQERTFLKPQELQDQYNLQLQRNLSKLEDQNQSERRRSYILQSSRWKNTQENEANYLKRNDGRLQSRAIQSIRAYHQRELERKYAR